MEGISSTRPMETLLSGVPSRPTFSMIISFQNMTTCLLIPGLRNESIYFQIMTVPPEAPTVWSSQNWSIFTKFFFTTRWDISMHELSFSFMLFHFNLGKLVDLCSSNYCIVDFSISFFKSTVYDFLVPSLSYSLSCRFFFCVPWFSPH